MVRLSPLSSVLQATRAVSMRYYGLEKLIDLYDGYRKSFQFDHHHLLLLQTANELFLIESRCPHQGHDLTAADIDGAAIRCPLHGYIFALKDGQNIHFSEAMCRNLRRYEIEYRGNEIGVML